MVFVAHVTGQAGKHVIIVMELDETITAMIVYFVMERAGMNATVVRVLVIVPIVTAKVGLPALFVMVLGEKHVQSVRETVY